MHPLAAKTVRRVLAAGGKIDPLEAFDDLAALDAAARATSELAIGRVCDLLDRPVIVGDDLPHGRAAVLWRPSYAAIEWIGDTAIHCGRWQDLCVAWALAMSRSPRLLREKGANARLAIRAANEWASDLTCSLEALLVAAAGLLDESRRGSASAHNSGDAPPDRAAARLTLARLVREFGQDEDYWLFGPRERTDAAIELLRRMDEAESKAIARAGGKNEARDPQSPEVQAFVRWRTACERFEQKYLAPRTEAP